MNGKRQKKQTAGSGSGRTAGNFGRLVRPVAPAGGGSSHQARSGPGRGLRGGRLQGVRIEAAKNTGQALRQLFRYFGRHAVLMLWATVLTLGSVAFRAAAPALIGRAIQNHIELSPDLSLFQQQILLVIVIYFAAWITAAAGGMLMSRMSNAIVFRLRGDVFTHVQELAVSSIDKQGIGELISRLTNDLEMISNALGNGFITLVGGLFSIISILVAMLLLNIQLTLLVLAVVPFMLVLTAFIGKRVRAAFRENQKQVGNLSAALEEAIAGVKVIQCFNREKEEYQRFSQINHLARRAGVRAELTAFTFMPIMQFLTSLIPALLVGIGGVLVLNHYGLFTVGLLTAFLLYAGRFFEPLRQMSEIYNVLQSALAGAERVFEVLALPKETDRVRPAKVLTRVRGHVQFKNVSFGYEAGKTVLKKINLEVKPGQVVAIVGPTGAGKTTLVNLLSRFYELDEGVIRLDGQDIRSLDIHFLRKQMGVVLQESFFFATSVLENLRYGNPEATEAQVKQAAVLAGADAFIRRLPQGYATVLAERGMNLSQGERQLLAIARVILADPRILILDEAFSNVDSLTEMHIQQGLLALLQGRTSFIIAHRLSTIKNADKVIVIHNQQIIEEGTHASLLAGKGFYARLYARQIAEPDISEEMIN